MLRAVSPFEAVALIFGFFSRMKSTNYGLERETAFRRRVYFVSLVMGFSSSSGFLAKIKSILSYYLRFK